MIDDDDGIWWYVWGHCSSSRAVSGIRFVATCCLLADLLLLSLCVVSDTRSVD